MRLAPALALVLLFLSACATTQRLDAASDVHALLVAIRDNDRAGFEARIDRRALQGQVEARLVAEARRAGGGELAGFAAAMAGPLAQIGGDALLRPSVFRQAAIYLGYDPSRPLPGQMQIAGALRYLPDGRVCAPRSKEGPCILTFTRQEGGWRLTSFDGDMSDLR